MKGMYKRKKPFISEGLLAVRTGLEPATSAVTGRHSNQLNYRTIYLNFTISAFLPALFRFDDTNVEG